MKALGVMIDCSRDAVYTVEALKQYFVLLRKMGYTYVQLYKRLLRYIDKKKITIDQYEKVLMALCKAKTEEDINAILTNALNCIIHHN